MPEDVGFWILMGALILALVVFVIGCGVQRPWVGRGVETEEMGDGPAPPGDSGAPGWWRVSSEIYNRYDLLMMGFIAAVYVSPLLMELFQGKQESPEMTISLAIGTVLMQLFLVVLVIGFVAWRKDPVRWLGLRWRLWPLALPIAVASVLATWFVVAVMEFAGFNEWLQGQVGHDGRQEVVKAFTETEDPAMLGALVLLAVVVAPLTEEVLFRGYFYPAAKHFIGRWPALVFGALVFAVAHNNAQAVVPLFVLALLLTLAYEFTGSIWAPIAIHVMFNGATVAAQLAMRFGWVEIPET